MCLKKQEKCNTVFFILSFLLLANYTQAQQRAPVNPAIRKADSLFMLSEWKNAKSMYESVPANTLMVPHWSRLGFSDYSLGYYDEAMQAYQKVISLNPPRPMRGLTFSRMAKIFSIRNDHTNALAMLDSALNNTYGNVSEMDTLKDFSNIRNDAAFKPLRQRAYAAAYPCMVNAHAREFDFWAGDWDVFVTGTNGRAGTSHVQIISNGCALLENWESPGSNGKSINYIDPTNNKWKQAWAGSYTNGVQEFVNGEYKDGAMRFSFETSNPQGQKIIGRFMFYNEKPGQVRQFNETSSDGGKTWVTSYDFTYIKMK